MLHTVMKSDATLSYQAVCSQVERLVVHGNVRHSSQKAPADGPTVCSPPPPRHRPLP